MIAPKREKKEEFLQKRDLIYDILIEGRKKAKKIAIETLQEVEEAMGL